MLKAASTFYSESNHIQSNFSNQIQSRPLAKANLTACLKQYKKNIEFQFLKKKLMKLPDQQLSNNITPAKKLSMCQDSKSNKSSSEKFLEFFYNTPNKLPDQPVYQSERKRKYIYRPRQLMQKQQSEARLLSSSTAKNSDDYFNKKELVEKQRERIRNSYISTYNLANQQVSSKGFLQKLRFQTKQSDNQTNKDEYQSQISNSNKLEGKIQHSKSQEIKKLDSLLKAKQQFQGFNARKCYNYKYKQKVQTPNEKSEEKKEEDIADKFTEQMQEANTTEVDEFLKLHYLYRIHLEGLCACYQCTCGHCQCQYARNQHELPFYNNKLISSYFEQFQNYNNNKLIALDQEQMKLYNKMNEQIKNKMQGLDYTSITMNDFQDVGSPKQCTVQKGFQPTNMTLKQPMLLLQSAYQFETVLIQKFGSKSLSRKSKEI